MMVVVSGKRRLVVSTPHARVWGVAIFGGLFLASYMSISDARPPYPGTGDPLGIVISFVCLALAVRSARLGLTLRPDVLVLRGYFLTRRIRVADIESVNVIDYPGPWWLNTERLKGLRLSRVGRRPLTVWGVTGSMQRVTAARQIVRGGIKDIASRRE